MRLAETGPSPCRVIVRAVLARIPRGRWEPLPILGWTAGERSVTIPAMAERPLLLLDVDGVLNPLRPPSADFQRHECLVGERSYHVHLNPGHGVELLKLAEETGARLVWATTWGHAANEWIGPRIGLPELPAVAVPMAPTRIIGPWGEMFKTPHVAAYVQGRPFVWFDDHTGGDDEEYLRAHPGVGEFLLVHVDPRHGLTPGDLALARKWLRRRRIRRRPKARDGECP